MSEYTQEIKCLTQLLEKGKMPLSAWPKSQNNLLEQLMRGSVVKIGVPAGARVQHIILTNKEAIEKRLKIRIAPTDTNLPVRSSNILLNGSSKSGKKLPYLTLMLTGGKAVGWEDSNGTPVSWQVPNIPSCLRMINLDERAPEHSIQPIGDVILVENKDIAINLPDILTGEFEGALVAFYGGAISTRLLKALKKWKYARFWVFPDLDPVGFSTIKKIKEEIPEARALIPQITDQMLRDYGVNKIWSDNTNLIPGFYGWLGTQSELIQNTFSMLSGAGAGLEQELFMALGKECVWLKDCSSSDKIDKNSSGD